MQQQKIGPDNRAEVPRAWFKLDGGTNAGEIIRDVAGDGVIGDAIDIALPEASPELYKLHLYDSKGDLEDLPSEVVMVTEDAEGFSMEVFSVLENDSITQRTEKQYDDSLNDLKVLHQVSQGQDHGYAHRDSHSFERYGDDDEGLLTIGELNGKFGDILKGRDDRSWKLETDTNSWSSKKELNPLDYYHIAPLGVPGKHGKFMDGMIEMIDDIIDSYEVESEGLLDLREERYGRMAEVSGEYGEKWIRGTIERFPEQMDKLYNDWVERKI